MSQMRTTWTLSPELHKEVQPKPFNLQIRGWQPRKRHVPWQSKPKIREIDIEQEPKQSGNNECAQ